MKIWVYRVSNSVALPRHWSYMDAWEIDAEEDDDGNYESVIVDNRAPGAQVWTDFARLVECLLGAECDGDYSWRAYKYMLLIEVEANHLVDSVGEWSAVLPATVKTMRVISTRKVVDALIGHSKRDLNVEPTPILTPTSGKRWERWLLLHSKVAKVRFVETLPRPREYGRLRVVRR